METPANISFWCGKITLTANNPVKSSEMGVQMRDCGAGLLIDKDRKTATIPKRVSLEDPVATRTFIDDNVDGS